MAVVKEDITQTRNHTNYLENTTLFSILTTSEEMLPEEKSKVRYTIAEILNIVEHKLTNVIAHEKWCDIKHAIPLTKMVKYYLPNHFVSLTTQRYGTKPEFFISRPKNWDSQFETRKSKWLLSNHTNKQQQIDIF